MKNSVSQQERLAFLARVTEKECQHLLQTDGRLFGNLFTVEDAQKIEFRSEEHTSELQSH